MGSAKAFYVYTHSDAAGVPFYVGKGQGNRAYVLHRRRNPYHQRKVASVGAANVRIDLFPAPTEAEAFRREVELIRWLTATGHVLTNLTPGGEGASGRDMALYPHVIEKLRKANTGRVKTPAEIEARASKLRGRKHSPARVTKMMQVHLGAKRSEETKRRVSDALTGRSLSPEHRKRSAEVLASVSAKAAEWHASPAGKEWHSENGKHSWVGRTRTRLLCGSPDCGRHFDTAFPTRALYCSSNCKERERCRRLGKPVGVRPRRRAPPLLPG